MQDVAGHGRTILFVSHNMPAVSRLTTRCVMLCAGEVHHEGDTGETIKIYVNGTDNEKRAEYDVTDTPRLYPGTEEARFMKLAFKRSSPSFSFDEDIDLMASVSTLKDIPNLRLSLTVCSMDGTPVGTTYSAQRVPIRKSAPNTIHFCLPAPRLAVGSYYCNIAIVVGSYSEGQVDYDVVTEVLKFEIRNGHGAGGESIYWNKGWGQVVLPDLNIL